MNATIEGLATFPTCFSSRETMNRLETEIRAQGMEVFARIDHAAAAGEAGLTLLPAEVIIFGHARSGTPLMQLAPTMGIDLPLRALVWQDAAGQTWLSYNEPGAITHRHGIGADGDETIKRMAAALSDLVAKATGAVHQPNWCAG